MTDSQKALQWYEEALDAERQGEIQITLMMLKKAARAGIVKAQARLSCLLWFGDERGVDKNRESARYWAVSALKNPKQLTTAQKVFLKEFLLLAFEEAKSEALQRSSEMFEQQILKAEEELKEKAIEDSRRRTTQKPPPPPTPPPTRKVLFQQQQQQQQQQQNGVRPSPRRNPKSPQRKVKPPPPPR